MERKTQIVIKRERKGQTDWYLAADISSGSTKSLYGRGRVELSRVRTE